MTCAIDYLFKQRVWMNPFDENDLCEVVEIIGDDRVLFGSDWRHIEGLPAPQDCPDDLQTFDDAAIRKIMREHAVELNQTAGHLRRPRER